MKKAPDLDGHAKSVMSEHVRPMIRIGGIKDSLVDRIWYEIIFLDPLTTRHFSQFQNMWDRRESRDQPFLEWWTQFKALIGNCIERLELRRIQVTISQLGRCTGRDRIARLHHFGPLQLLCRAMAGGPSYNQRHSRHDCHHANGHRLS
jgi:hypothetical protein